MDFDYGVAPVLLSVTGTAVIWLSVRRVRLLAVRRHRVAERVFLSVLILLVAVVAGSSAFNAIAIHHLSALAPPFGDMYLVGDHRMRMDCVGSGSPTIVLESGLGNDGLIWGKVQPELSRTTRVCSYDRAGYGWSDPGTAPRDADHIAAELHGLLLQAKITGPIILMGHSIGGMYIRDYATRYPEEIAGLIFVDASTPLQGQSSAFRNIKQPPQWIYPLLTQLAYITNLPRLLGACSTSLDANPLAWKLSAEGLCHPQLRAMADEGKSFERSGRETVSTGPYGALPVLVFSHDPAKTKGPVRWENAWSQMQEGLKKLSTRSRRIIARDSTHYVQLDRASLVGKEVSLFIEQIRGTARQPMDFGSTNTE